MNKDLTVGKPEVVLWKFCLPLLGSIMRDSDADWTFAL